MIFKRILSRNLMSIGDQPVEFILNANAVTVIVGANGSGKSTGLIDALFYNLFGKPFRKDFSIVELVNDETKKDLYTESEFSNNGIEYMVKRGRKSSTEFEIYKNGDLIKVPADLKTYQKYLEESILGFDAETFKQVVILGSSAYVPFMKLDTIDRRKVVEDLLAIRIFSYMNDVAKDDAKNVRAEIEAAQYAYDMSRQKYHSAMDNLSNLKSQASTNVGEFSKQIDSNNEKIKAHFLEIEKLKLEVESITVKIVDPVGKRAIYTETQTTIADADRARSLAITNAKFYKDNTVCPECKQAILDDFRQTKFNEFKQANIEALASKEEALKIQETVHADLLVIRDLMNSVNELNQKISTANSQVSSLQYSNQQLEANINRQSGASSAHLIQAEADVELHKNSTEVLKTKLDEIMITRAHYAAAIELLKDDKIKGDVIRSYIPIINQYVQQNLNVLDFPAKFSIDEKFKETIILNGKPRSYAALSEGQKMRVDLAILFAWRSVAAAKNSAESSLLIFDEIGSSSMDSEGMALFQKLVEAHNKNSNVFMITHDSRVASEYSNVIEVKMINKVTTISKIEG